MSVLPDSAAPGPVAVPGLQEAVAQAAAQAAANLQAASDALLEAIETCATAAKGEAGQAPERAAQLLAAANDAAAAFRQLHPIPKGGSGDGQQP